MNSLVEKILDRKFEDAGKVFEEAMISIVKKKLSEEKKRVAAECSCDGGAYNRQKMLAKDVLEDKEEPKVTQSTEQEVNEDNFEKNLTPISQDGVDPARTAKLAAMAGSQPSIAKGPPPTNADKEKAAQFEEDVELKEARINLIKARIRGGKIQRRKKVSNVPGFTLRAGQLTRMSAAERRHRKLGAKRAARKTKMKKTQVLRKRRISLQKRQRLGI
jgi:hypothetical protein